MLVNVYLYNTRFITYVLFHLFQNRFHRFTGSTPFRKKIY